MLSFPPLRAGRISPRVLAMLSLLRSVPCTSATPADFQVTGHGYLCHGEPLLSPPILLTMVFWMVQVWFFMPFFSILQGMHGMYLFAVFWCLCAVWVRYPELPVITTEASSIGMPSPASRDRPMTSQIGASTAERGVGFWTSH